MPSLRAMRLSVFVLLSAALACSLPVGPAATLPPTSTTSAASASSSAVTPAGATALPATSAAPLLNPAKLKQGLDADVPTYMRANNIFACSLAVVSPALAAGSLQIQYFNYGMLSRQSNTPVNSSTEYEIGSITKLFTADLLALNVQSSRMQLDDPLQKYLPAGVRVPVYQGQAITLRELSTHTSGLPRTLPKGTTVSKVNGVLMWGYNSDQEIYAFLNSYQLTRAPGSKWEYSNLANGLLGIAEEQAGRDGYENLVVAAITGPLAMGDTRIVLTAEQNSRLAQGYEPSGAKAPSVATQGGTLAAGALRSNTHDMAIYLAHNIDPGSAQPDPVFAFTQQQQDKGPGKSVVMGLGWLIANPGATDELFNKDGSTAGYNSYIAFSKTRRTGFVLLCNGHPIEPLLPAIEKLLGLSEAASDTNQ